MAGDLPPGKWSAALVGTWWCQSGATLKQAGQHWDTQSQEQTRFGGDLRTQWQQLAAGNSGKTADDLISRYQNGEQFHMDLAEKYSTKHTAFNSGADAMDNLRSGLTGIAADYNQRISDIESKPGGIGTGVAKMAAITSLITEAQGFAAHKSAAAVASIMDAVQKILTAEGISMSPQEFLKSQGISTDSPPPPDPQKAAEDGLGMGGQGAGSGEGGGQSGDHTSPLGNEGAPGTGPGALPGGADGSDIGGQGHGGSGPGAGVGGGPGGMPIGTPGGGGRVPGGVPGGGQGTGGLSPAASVGKGLSPESLGQSFSSGAASGQPAAAGANSLTAGTMNTVESGQPAPAAGAHPMAPQVVSAPTISSGMESAGAEHASAAAAPAAAPVVSTGGDTAAPAGPTVVAGPAPAATGGPVAPAGPLPAYGSDLRPPVVAPPAAPAMPAGPMSGAPVAPSPTSAPSAGGPLAAPVDRSAAAAAAAAQSQSASGSAMAAAAAGAATAGGAAGDVSGRAAEQQRLQRIVDACARQEPRLAWAAGLHEDGKTILVCDVGCGWIPPSVRIPHGVDRLLEPAVRRDVAVVDLLGSVVVAAAYQPAGYIAAPGPEEPALTADLRARKVSTVDEFGPTLMDHLRRVNGLPRMTQALAGSAIRKTGLGQNEVDAFHDGAAGVPGVVLNAYPAGKESNDYRRALVNWMLLGCVDALFDDHPEIANYHLAWANALSSKGVAR